MKYLFKILISMCTVLLLTVQMSLFTSCNDAWHDIRSLGHSR
jgi:hypothetical protein